MSTATVCPAQVVFGIPDLAEEIFKHVRLYWRKAKRQYDKAHKDRRMLHANLCTVFETANMELQMNFRQLMMHHKAVSTLVGIRHRYYRVRDKCCDFNNTWYFSASSHLAPIERFEEEIASLYDESFTPGAPNAVKSHYNGVMMRRCHYLQEDLLDYPYYHHLMVFYGAFNPYNIATPWHAVHKYKVLEALYCFVLEDEDFEENE